MTALASTDVTITVDSADRHVLGKLRMASGSIAFGDGALTYPNGGVEMPAIGNFGMSKEVKNLSVVDASGYGLLYRYDQTNRKVQIFVPAPPIVHEEVVTVTANVGYLKWPAAHIEYVSDGADAFLVIPGGLTPVQKSVAADIGFSLTTGVLTRGQRCSLTFHASDSITSVYVSYVTQAWKEVTDNMVQACMTSGERTYGHADLTFTAGTPDVVKLGEDFVALQSVCFNNGGTITPMTALVDDGTDGAAATECVVDFRKTTTFGEVAFNETDAVDTTSDVVYFNYVKDPGAGSFLYDRFTNATIADSSDTYTFTGWPLLYATCGGFPMESTTKKTKMTSSGTTLAAGEAKWTSHPFLPGTTMAIVPIATAHGDTDVDITPAWIAGHPSEIAIVPLEIPDGTIVQAITLQMMAWGK